MPSASEAGLVDDLHLEAAWRDPASTAISARRVALR